LEAARWNARAATRLVRSDLTEAVRRWRSTLGLLAGLPEGEEVLRLGIDARTRLLQFGSRMGLPPDEAQTLFEEGKVLAERLGDVGQLAGITQFHGTVKLAEGEVRQAVACYSEAARLADKSDDDARRAAGWMSPPVFMAYTGSLPKALRLVEKAILLCEGDPDRGVQHAGYSPLVSAVRTHAELLSLMGRLSEAGQGIESALLMARERSEAEMSAWSLATYVRLAQYLGEDQDSLAHAKEAVRLTEDSGNLMFRVVALGALGLAALREGHWDEATATLLRALEERRAQRGRHFEEARILCHLARAHLESGDGLAAKRAVRDAVLVAEEQGTKILLCLALLTRAQVHRLTEDMAEEETILTDLTYALNLADETGARTFEPFIKEELARVTGEQNGLQEAFRIFSAMGATGHVRRLEPELART
jgi:tetratricopeptide (TPR) repeat protein